MTDSQPVIRVLVVDDSVVARQMVVRALESQDDIRVVGVAADGVAALAKLRLLVPDMVILDLEMPVMDGFETLSEIRRIDPRLPVIIFSNLTTSGASATLDALDRGATAFILKPTANGIGQAQDYIRTEMLPLIRALARPPESSALRQMSPEIIDTTLIAPTAAARTAPRNSTAPVAVIVIAISTGGPKTLTVVLSDLPPDLPVPVLVVQHMPPMFTATLAERLDRQSALRVIEASGGETPTPGHVYIAPGGHHMTVARYAGAVTIVLHDGPPENSCRPAADVLFRSAVEVFGSGVLAAVLTGMGHDGLAGARDVRAAGGSVIAQTAATSVVASMPSAVIDAGLADAVVPLDQIAATLTCWSRQDSMR